MSEKSEELANLYWRKRQEPGGTIERADGRIGHSDECQVIWEQIIAELDAERAGARDALLAMGVPPKLAATGQRIFETSEDSIRWSAAWPHEAALRLDPMLSELGCRLIEEWTDGTRYVWTDDAHLIFTLCEGDLSGEWYTTAPAFHRAYMRAIDFYDKRAR